MVVLYVLLVTVVPAVIIYFALGMMGYFEDPVKDTAPDAPKLSLSLSNEIYNEYEELSDDFKTFPELFNALLTLEEKTRTEGNTDYYGLRHSTDCKHYPHRVYLPSEKRSVCEVCKPFMALKNAVRELSLADRHRQKILDEEAKRSTLAEIDGRLTQYDDLAERIRRDASVHREVTKDVFES